MKTQEINCPSNQDMREFIADATQIAMSWSDVAVRFVCNPEARTQALRYTALSPNQPVQYWTSMPENSTFPERR